MFGPWIRLATETTLLAAEAQSVIAMRLTQIAVGRGSAAEAQLMVTEKMLALAEAATTVVAGGTAHAVVNGYRRKVRANAKRLRRTAGRTR
jgi:hypothetical protein